MKLLLIALLALAGPLAAHFKVVVENDLSEPVTSFKMHVMGEPEGDNLLDWQLNPGHQVELNGTFTTEHYNMYATTITNYTHFRTDKYMSGHGVKCIKLSDLNQILAPPPTGMSGGSGGGDDDDEGCSTGTGSGTPIALAMLGITSALVAGRLRRPKEG